MVADDRKHAAARAAFEELAASEAALISSSYVLVETYALLQRRIGVDAVTAMKERLAPLVEITWVGRSLHDAGLDRLVDAGRKKLSLVDCVSFEIMKRRHIDRAFAYDRHFEGEGFALV